MKLRPTRPWRARPGRLDVIILVSNSCGNFLASFRRGRSTGRACVQDRQKSSVWTKSTIVKPRPRRKSIVIIDDHIFLRQGLERILNATDEFFVCEEAGNAADGLDAVREMRPDAVIVDVGLPDISGIELTKQLVAEFPGVIVLILSMHEEAEYAVRAMQAGARGWGGAQGTPILDAP